MVLIVMVGVLVYRVHKVIDPEERETIDKLRAPVESYEGLPPEERPPLTPLPPTIDIKDNYTNLINRNPFWLYAKGSGTSKPGEVTAEDLGITLHKILENRGRLTAQISTQTGLKRWRSQDAQFEQFELVDINQEEQTITIYSQQYNKDFTFTMP